MIRASLSVGLLLVTAGVWAAEESEPLDADFLEYLANLEGDEDNWTLLVDAEPARGSSQQADTQASKPSKEAAKPAADER